MSSDLIESELLNAPTGARLARPGRLAVVLLCFVCACESPSWSRDRIVVEGALTDTSCTLKLDGRPITGDTSVPRLFIVPDDALNSGQRLSALTCRGLQITVPSPRATVPPAGRYRVTNDSSHFSPGTVTAILAGSGVGTGGWPFAPTGVYLVGIEGTVQIDNVTESTARGSFRLVMRRRVSGE
jgi:hypothetical protein